MFTASFDTHSLDEFASHSEEYAKQIRQSRRPMVLTVDGRPELVVQDVEGYQALLDAVERAKTVESLNRGLCQMRRGEGRSVTEAVDEIQSIGDRL